MNNWELKAIAVLIAIGLIAVLAHITTNYDWANAALVIGLILIIIGSIAVLFSGFVLLISAFSHDVTTGLLFLFIPFYSFYFAISQYDGNNRALVLGSYLLGNLILFIGVPLFWLSIPIGWLYY